MRCFSWMAQARKEKKLTQQQLADIVGISRSYLTQIEIGLRMLNTSTAIKLGKALDIPWTRWFDDPINPKLIKYDSETTSNGSLSDV